MVRTAAARSAGGVAEAVREGRSREFAPFLGDEDDVPDPQSEETFLRSKLDWDEMEKPERARVFEWYKRLIRLRRTHPSLAPGLLGEDDVRFSESPAWLSVRREGLQLVFNLSEHRQEVPRIHGCDGPANLILTNDETTAIRGDAVRLVPRGVAVVQNASGRPTGGLASGTSQ
mgnify:CR=1 FL=1